MPLFIPDLPGYGRSSLLLKPHTKRNVGNAILFSLSSLFPSKPNSDSIPIILCGHDRGARIAHRLAVDLPLSITPKFILKGTILLDIIPATTQWENASLRSAVNFFHWSFLPNIELATAMISAFGGEKWVSICLSRWAGDGLVRLQSDNAEQVYRSFGYEHVIRASCDDYRASAKEEEVEWEEDMKEGKKVDGDVLVLYSAEFLPTRGKVESWKEWTGMGRLEMRGFGDGVGHFVAEEAPERTAEAVRKFYEAHL